jgi:hypothetical protein
VKKGSLRREISGQRESRQNGKTVHPTIVERAADGNRGEVDRGGRSGTSIIRGYSETADPRQWRWDRGGAEHI